MTPKQFHAIRHQLGLTQAELAAQVGYKHAWQISHIETGNRPIPPLLARLMTAYRDLHKLQPKKD